MHGEQIGIAVMPSVAVAADGDRAVFHALSRAPALSRLVALAGRSGVPASS